MSVGLDTWNWSSEEQFREYVEEWCWEREYYRNVKGRNASTFAEVRDYAKDRAKGVLKESIATIEGEHRENRGG